LIWLEETAEAERLDGAAGTLILVAWADWVKNRLKPTRKHRSQRKMDRPSPADELANKRPRRRGQELRASIRVCDRGFCKLAASAPSGGSINKIFVCLITLFTFFLRALSAPTTRGLNNDRAVAEQAVLSNLHAVKGDGLCTTACNPNAGKFGVRVIVFFPRHEEGLKDI